MEGREEKNNVAAIVPAAGRGTRLGLGPKAFLKLGGNSLILRVVENLSGCLERIVVGVPPNQVEKARAELKNTADVFHGGDSRQETVFLLLKKCNEEIILIHDATRPFASQPLIKRVIEAAKEHGASASCISSNIPLAECQGNFITGYIPRSRIRISQSPQAYRRDILERAYKHAIKNGLSTQTTWQLVIELGVNIRIVQGEEQNIKITTPFDWEIARKVILPARLNKQEREDLE